MAPRYILACFVFIFCRVDGETLYGLKSVSLKPGIPGKPADILWKHNGNKVVEFNGNEQHVYGTFENRITLDWHTAEIVITDLRFEDSGIYDLEAVINNKLHQTSKTLVVIDKVPKPTISCKMNNGSSSDKSGTLECSAESEDSQTQSLMKFEWTSHGNVQPGPQLTISLGGEHDDHEYFCNVSNPMSSETATFTAKDCYPDESSSVPLAAGLVTLFLLLIIFVVLGIAVCYKTQKACFAVKRAPPGSTESLRNTTPQAEESVHLLHTPVPFEDKRKMFEGRKDEVLPLPKLPPEPVKKKGAADEPVNLDKNKKPHQESCSAPEELVPFEERRKMFEGIKGPDRNMNKGNGTPVLPRGEFPRQDPDNLTISDKADADADQLRDPAEAAQSDHTDPEKENEPDPADEPANSEEDKKPQQESSSAPEETESLKKEGVADEPANLDEDKKPHQDSSAASEDSGFGTTLSESGVENNNDKHEKTGSPTTSPRPDRNINKGNGTPVLPRGEFPRQDPDNLTISDKADAEADQLREPAEAAQSEPTDPEKENEPDPADEPANSEEDKKPQQDSSSAPEETGPDRNMNKGKGPPVLPRIALSPERAKKEDPADESVD